MHACMYMYKLRRTPGATFARKAAMSACFHVFVGLALSSTSGLSLGRGFATGHRGDMSRRPSRQVCLSGGKGIGTSGSSGSGFLCEGTL